MTSDRNFQKISFRCIAILLIDLFCATDLKAQNADSQIVYSNAHGLRNGTSIFLEVEGYLISTSEYDDLYFDKTGIRIAKRKNRIDKKLEGETNQQIKTVHKVFIQKGIGSYHDIFYFYPAKDNRIKVIAMSTMMDRDYQLEEIFANAIISNELPEEIFSEDSDSIELASRILKLDVPCRWMGPHNLQCPNYGQLSWSEFRSLEKAKTALQLDYARITERSAGEVLESDSINVIFQEVPTKAFRVKYQVKIPKLVMGGSNILIIYYVATQVRNKYLACVMSHYTDDAKKDGLGQLLSELMYFSDN